MPSAAYDLGYLEAGLEEFKNFLSSNSLFFPLYAPPPMGEKAYPRLTLGGVLFSIARLHARELTASQAAQFRKLCIVVEDWRISRRELWERKARRELASRIRQWRLHLIEFRKDPGRNLDYYLSEVTVRVLIELLAKEIKPHDDETMDDLNAMDRELRLFFQAGNFIWEAPLASIFPAEPFWYLWGKPVCDEDLLWKDQF